MKSNKYFFLILSLSFIFGIIYAIHCIVPYINNEYFVPIRLFSNPKIGYDDNYFWYAIIKNITDGDFIFNDPITYEFKKYISINNTYNLSLIFGSLAGLIFDKLSKIYIFNFLIFPTINFIVISLLIRIFTKEILINLLVTTFVVFLTHPTNIYFILFSNINILFQGTDFFLNNKEFIVFNDNQLHRMPNIMVSNIFLFINFLIIFNYHKLDTKIKILFSIILIGASIYFSVINFLITYTALFLYYIFFFKNNDLSKNLIFIFLSMIISLPGIILVIESFFSINIINEIKINFDHFKKNQVTNFNFNSFFILYNTIKLIFFIVFILAVSKLLILPKKYLNYLLILILSTLIPFFVISLFFGDYFGWRIINRGGILLISVAIYFPLFLLIQNYFRKVFVIISITSILFLNLFFFIIHLNNSLVNNERYNDKEFYLLNEWIDTNLSNKDVIVSLDPDIIFNIPLYTTANLYFPQAQLSNTKIEDRLDRMVEITFNYGFNNTEIIDFFMNKKSINYNDKFNFILFYNNELNQQEYKKISEDIINKYKKTKSNKILFKNKANYLLISNFDEILIKPNSIIYNYIKLNEPIYENKNYKIIEIKK